MVLLKRIATVALFVAIATVSFMQSIYAFPSAVTFGDHPFFHRWSGNDQNEFTPEGQENLATWLEMITLNVHSKISDGDELAELANGILGNYQQAGKIIWTDSIPRTENKPAEHLIVAILSDQDVMEAVFARVMLIDNIGLVAVYSRRAYGKDAAAVMSTWLQEKGLQTQNMLMSWDRIPHPNDLKTTSVE